MSVVELERPGHMEQPEHVERKKLWSIMMFMTTRLDCRRSASVCGRVHTLIGRPNTRFSRDVLTLVVRSNRRTKEAEYQVRVLTPRVIEVAFQAFATFSMALTGASFHACNASEAHTPAVPMLRELQPTT